MGPAERIVTLERELAQARAMTLACLEFLRAEMHWEGFRAEMLYHDDIPKQNASEENARRLHNFLVEHGAQQLLEAVAKPDV
jgi:hypothetical protein